jgi:hypothetical protein
MTIQVGYGEINSDGDIVDVIDSTVSSVEEGHTAMFALQQAQSENADAKYFFVQIELIPGEGNFRKVCYLDPL